jgi:hypothetical protein
MEDLMPRFEFTVGKSGAVRRAGTVMSDSFTDALEAIAVRSEVTEGETLEIGVPGFPPARYEFVIPAAGTAGWQPDAPRLAA